MRKFSEKKDFPKGKIRSNGFYTLLANRFFKSVKRLFNEYYVQNSNYGKFQIILLVFNLSLLAILIFRCLKDL